MRTIVPYWTSRGFASDFFDEMERIFDNWESGPSTRAYDEKTFDPAFEIAESGEHYLMSVDLPGMKKEDIKIEVSDNILTISGERKRESSDKNGFFKRSFTLPSSVETGKVEARYENGVLELYLPKTQVAKPRQIEVQSGKSGIFSKLLGSNVTSTAS
jgi:HSP20 family protein